MTDDLDARQWQRLRELFEQARPLGEAARAVLLVRVRATDPHLADALGPLLAAHGEHADNTDRDRSRLLDDALDIVAEPPLHTGSGIGPYVLQRELGRGGMGVVFLASRADGRVRQQVAVKVLGRHVVDAHARRRFMQEREILASLDHPHIARLLDAGEADDGSPYYVMEYIAGIPLTAHCDNERLPVAARLRLFLAVCEAVQHAHAALVLHRDIKPGNILVAAGGVPKLIDFGIAKLLDFPGDATATRQRFFSPTNAAPEQLLDGRPTVACDVYQLGTVLYELLCGRQVFEVGSLTPAQLEQHILGKPPEAPSAVAARNGTAVARARGVPAPQVLANLLRGDLDNIVLQAVRKAPSERYASVGDFAADIRRHLERRPVNARRGHAWYRGRKFVSRHRVGVAFGVAAVVAVIASVVVFALQAERLQHERDVARQDRDRADATTRFLVGIFRLADPATSLTRDMSVADVLANAGRQLGLEASGQPVVRAQLSTALADVHLALGDYDAARRLVDESRSLLAAQGLQRSRLWLAATEVGARVEGATGNTRRAYELAGQVLALHAQLGDPPAAQWVARHTRVRALEDFGSPAAALAAYRELYAQMLAQGGVEPRRLAQVEVQFAQLLAPERDPFAGELIARAVGRLVQALPQGHPDLLWARAVEADYRDAAADGKTDALTQLRRIHREQVDLLGADSLPATATLAWIAAAQARRGAHAQAVAASRQVQRIYAGIHRGAHTDVVEADRQLGDHLASAGRLDDAAATFATAVAMARSLWGADGYRTAAIEAQFGAVRALQGRLDEAQPLLAHAATVLTGVGRAGIEAHLQLADVLLRRGQTGTARATLDAVAPALAADAPDGLRERAAALRERTGLEMR